MAAIVDVEFVTQFTGDLTDIMEKLHAYQREMQNLQAQGTVAFRDMAQSVKLTGDEYRATLSGMARGTTQGVETFRSLNSSIAQAGTTFRELGMNVSGVMGSFATFGNIIAQLQMPMIWMQWRQEQLMVTQRRLRTLTDDYRESLIKLGPAHKETQELARRLNEERMLASVYTQRLERAQLMMNIAYLTSAAQIFPALVNLYDTLNRLAGSRIATIIAETTATWNLAAAKMALVAAMPWLIPAVIAGAGALMVTMGAMAARVPPTARGQFGGEVLQEGFAYVERGERLTFGGAPNITINVNGAMSPRQTARDIESVLDNYFRRKYSSRGLRAV